MKSRRAPFAAVVLTAAALGLTSCSSGAPGGAVSSSPALATSPTPGSPAPDTDAKPGRSGTFEVVPPEGWVDATPKATSGTVELTLISSSKVDDFANNVVIQSSTGGGAAAEIARGRKALADLGRTVTDAPKLTVGGETATGFTTSSTEQGHEVTQVFYGFDHGGRSYLFTLSSAKSDAANARTQLDEIVATWAWTTR